MFTGDETEMPETDNHKPKTKASTQRKLALPKRTWHNPRTWRRNLPLPPRNKISSVTKLLRQAFALLGKDWRTFGGISLVYAVGVFIFVKSFSVSSSITDTETLSGVQASGVFDETFTKLSTLFADASASISAASGVYQIIISTICVLALIWAFRQLLSHEKAGVKSSFYQGMTPLVKYLLVLAMIGVQLIPVALGSYLFSIIIGSGMFFGWELWAAGFVFVLLALWSMRLVTHSIFALFITTLPDMTPLKSLQSAKKMVYRRRLTLWRKLLGAVLYFALVTLLVMLPFVIWLPAAASWVLFILTVLAVPYGQAYLYVLYREIL